MNRKLRFFAALQHCLDLAMSRLCRQEAHLILIVGCQSNVEGVTFPVSAIVEKVACEAVGMRLCQVQEVAFVNRFGKRVRENVLHLRVVIVQDEGDLVARAHKVGRSFLVCA